jgi:hypothetical protein
LAPPNASRRPPLKAVKVWYSRGPGPSSSGGSSIWRQLCPAPWTPAKMENADVLGPRTGRNASNCETLVIHHRWVHKPQTHRQA